jgi:hypothetical protein
MPMIDQPPRDRDEVIAEYQLLAKVEAWAETGEWDVAADGPPPFAAGCRVPAELLPKRIRIARKGPARQPRPATRAARGIAYPEQRVTIGDVMVKFVADYERWRRAA